MNSNNNQTREANEFATQTPKFGCPGLPSLPQASLLDPVTRSWDKLIRAESIHPAGHTSDEKEHRFSDLDMDLGVPKMESPSLYQPKTRRVTWEDTPIDPFRDPVICLEAMPTAFAGQGS